MDVKMNVELKLKVVSLGQSKQPNKYLKSATPYGSFGWLFITRCSKEPFGSRETTQMPLTVLKFVRHLKAVQGK